MRILSILRDIVSHDPTTRARGADDSTDLIRDLSDPETLTLTFTLACAYEIEDAAVAQEAQLHAMAEFAEGDALPGFVLQRVLSIDKKPREATAIEYLEYLNEVNGY